MKLKYIFFEIYIEISIIYKLVFNTINSAIRSEIAFQDYIYIQMNIIIKSDDILYNICMNLKCEMIFINQNWFETSFLNISILQVAILVRIKEIDDNVYINQ